MGQEEIKTLFDAAAWEGAVVLLCAAAAGFLLVCKVIDAVKKLRRPKGDQPREGVLPECDRKFDSDHRMLTRHDREINEIRDALQVLCSGQWALLEHALHNGNADQLQEASGGLRKYLEKRI